MTPRLLLLALALASAPALAQNCPVDAGYPGEEWPSRVAEVASSRAQAIAELEAWAFTLQGADGDRQGLRTDGFLIFKDGALVYERYGRGYTASNRHLSWSVAKSVSSVLIGVAVRQGLLGLDDSICKHLTEYEGQDACRITVRHVLTFTSGLDWNEGYENEPYQQSSVISMLYGVGRHNALVHILRTHKLTADPGTRWSYSTGDATVVGTVAKRALGKAHGPTAFWTQLFDTLGMKRVVFEEDANGSVQGGSMLYATPRDFARVGHLMLRDGCWNGQRLVPEGWVRDSVAPSPQFATQTLRDPNETSPTPNGYSWWVNQPTPSRGWTRPWPDAPPDAYAALGHWGQRVIVVPSEQVVIVRTGDDRNASMDPNDIVKYALPVAR